MHRFNKNEAFRSHGELVHYVMDTFKPSNERVNNRGTVTLTGLKFAKPRPSKKEIERIQANREAKALATFAQDA